MAASLSPSAIEKLQDQAKAVGRSIEMTDKGSTRSVPGLRLRVTPHDSASFYLLYKPKGTAKLKRLMIGKYPHMTVSDARKAASINKGEVSAGGDPLLRLKQ